MFQTEGMFANSLVTQPAIPISLVRSLGCEGGWVVYQGLLCSLPYCMQRMSLVTVSKQAGSLGFAQEDSLPFPGVASASLLLAHSL